MDVPFSVHKMQSLTIGYNEPHSMSMRVREPASEQPASDSSHVCPIQLRLEHAEQKGTETGPMCLHKWIMTLHR